MSNDVVDPLVRNGVRPDRKPFALPQLKTAYVCVTPIMHETNQPARRRMPVLAIVVILLAGGIALTRASTPVRYLTYDIPLDEHHVLRVRYPPTWMVKEPDRLGRDLILVHRAARGPKHWIDTQLLHIRDSDWEACNITFFSNDEVTDIDTQAFLANANADPKHGRLVQIRRRSSQAGPVLEVDDSGLDCRAFFLFAPRAPSEKLFCSATGNLRARVYHDADDIVSHLTVVKQDTDAAR